MVKSGDMGLHNKGVKVEEKRSLNLIFCFNSKGKVSQVKWPNFWETYVINRACIIGTLRKTGNCISTFCIFISHLYFRKKDFFHLTWNSRIFFNINTNSLSGHIPSNSRQQKNCFSLVLFKLVLQIYNYSPDFILWNWLEKVLEFFKLQLHVLQ